MRKYYLEEIPFDRLAIYQQAAQLVRDSGLVEFTLTSLPFPAEIPPEPRDEGAPLSTVIIRIDDIGSNVAAFNVALKSVQQDASN